MSIHRFETVLTVPAPIDEVWDFFSDPRNLAEITPPDMGFEITSDLPDRAYAGLIITYRVRPLGPIPVIWVTEITHLDEGRYFVDEQRSGPYRLWHHQHHFRAAGGETEMRDIVHYQLPFGPAGDIVQKLVVRERVRLIFAYREQAIARRFGRIRPIDLDEAGTFDAPSGSEPAQPFAAGPSYRPRSATGTSNSRTTSS